METNQIKLASEIANALNDRDSIQAYMLLTERYSEDFLRKTLQKVLLIPKEKIRKTPGALFTFLVKQHNGPAQANNTRD